MLRVLLYTYVYVYIYVCTHPAVLDLYAATIIGYNHDERRVDKRNLELMTVYSLADALIKKKDINWCEIELCKCKKCVKLFITFTMSLPIYVKKIIRNCSLF